MTTNQLEKRILSLHKGGMGMLRIAKELKVGTSVVQRVLHPFRVENDGVEVSSTRRRPPSPRPHGLESLDGLVIVPSG
jgi:transposase